MQYKPTLPKTSQINYITNVKPKASNVSHPIVKIEPVSSYGEPNTVATKNAEVKWSIERPHVTSTSVAESNTRMASSTGRVENQRGAISPREFLLDHTSNETGRQNEMMEEAGSVNDHSELAKLTVGSRSTSGNSAFLAPKDFASEFLAETGNDGDSCSSSSVQPPQSNRKRSLVESNNNANCTIPTDSATGTGRRNKEPRLDVIEGGINSSPHSLDVKQEPGDI